MAGAFRAGATALITGSGSGVGFAVAKLCRSRGMNLVLVDIHTENLAKAHTTLDHDVSPSSGAKTITHTMDVSDRPSWELLRDKVSQSFPAGIDLLMLNAGAAYRPTTAENDPWQDPSYFEKVRLSFPSWAAFICDILTIWKYRRYLDILNQCPGSS